MAGHFDSDNQPSSDSIPQLPLHGDGFHQEEGTRHNSQYMFTGLPMDPQDVAAALVRAADKTVDALNTVCEEQVTERAERCLRDLSDGLERLAWQLPTKPEECKLVAELLAAQSRLAPGEAPALSKEAALAGLCTVAAMLMDVRAAVTGVSKQEVAELVDIGLPLARGTAVALQGKAIRLQQSISPQTTVFIEDLDEIDDNGMPTPRLLPALSDTPCRVTLCHGRYLWRPLWPRLRSELCPQLLEWAASPSILAAVQEKPVQTTALAVVLGPAAVWTTVLVAPSILLGDAAVQRIYQWTGPEEVDEVLAGIAQTSRFGYLSGRILVRQSLRVAQTQARRFLGGRTPVEAGVDIMKDCWRDPVGSVQTSVGHARWASERLFFGLQQLHSQVSSFASSTAPTT